MRSAAVGEHQFALGDLLDRKLVNDVVPRVEGGWLDGAQSFPHSAVAFEAGAKGDLPHSVASSHSALGLGVRQLVPQGAAGSVAESVPQPYMELTNNSNEQVPTN